MSQSLLSKNNKVLKGANTGNSWVNITLDTAAPEVDIESTLSYKNATALFEFTNGSVDFQKFKTWGDYDTSPSGINYDLCGTTELNAPLVDVRDDILFSLGNTSPVAQHTFYFKLIDDVWNETTVTVEGEYEPTVLVDASDFAKAKDCYFNVYLYYDRARISGSALVVEDEEDWFAYKEWVSGNEIFGKDFYSFREQLIGMLFTSDIGTLDSETYLKVNGIDTFYYEEAISDPPSVRPVVVFGIEIITAKEQNLLVFPADHKSTSYDATIVNVPDIDPASTKLYKIHFTYKFIQTEPAKVSYQFLTGYENTDYSFEISDVSLVNASSDMGIYLPNAWVDLDYIAKDFGFGIDIPVVAFPMEEVKHLIDSSMLGLSLEDEGVQPTQPIWSFAVDVAEEITGKDYLENSVYGTDIDIAFDELFLGVALDDVGVEKDPDWSFAVDAKDEAIGFEYLTNWLEGEDQIKSIEDPAIDVRVEYAYKEVLRVWYDTDYILKDYGFAFDPAVINDAIYEVPVIENSAIVNSASKDYFNVLDIAGGYSKTSVDYGTGWGKLYAGHIGNELVYSIDEPEIILVPLSDKIQYKTRTIVDQDLYFKDMGAGFEVMSPLNVLGDDSFTVTEHPIISVAFWDAGLAKFVVSIHDEEAPIEYIFAADVAFGINEKGTVEVVGIDPLTGLDYAIVLTCNEDVSYVKDTAPVFEKVYTDLNTGFDYVNNIHIFGEDYFISNISSVISVFVESDWGSSRSALAEFYTNYFDANVVIEKVEFGIVGEDTGVAYDTALLGVEFEDSFKEKEQIIEFYKGLFEKVLYKDTHAVTIPVEDAAVLAEHGVPDMALKEYGEIRHALSFGIHYFDKYSYKEGIVLSVLGEDSFFATASVELMTFSIDYGISAEKLSQTTKIILKDEAFVSFETVMNLVSSLDFAVIQEDVIIGLGLEDISYVTFYVDIKGKKPPETYIDVYDFGSGSGYGWVDILGDDAFCVENENGFLNLFGEDHHTYQEYLIKEFTSLDPGFGEDLCGFLNIPIADFGRLSNESIMFSFFDSDYFTYKYFLKKEFNTFDDVIGKDIAYTYFLFDDYFCLNEGYVDFHLFGNDYFSYKYFILKEFNSFDHVNSKDEKYVSSIFEDYFQLTDEYVGLNVYGNDYFTYKYFLIKEFDSIDYAWGKDVFAGLNTFVDEVVIVDNESVIIGPATKEFFTPHIHFIKEFNTFEDGEHCYNTIIYDPTIAFWDLMYWWEPGYAPGGKYYYDADSSGTYFVRNKDWGKPIKPGDIDYPYYKDDFEYGREISVLTEPTNTYKAWVGDKSWVGAGEECTVESSNTSTIFTSYSPLSKFSTFHVDVIEYYMVTTTYIPWTTHFEINIHAYHYTSNGNYTLIGSRLLVASKSIQSQTFIDGNKRKTVYKLNPEVKELDCYELFPGYDLRRDYFVVTLTCTFSWTATFYRGVVYKINAEYMYYGDYSTTNALYIKSRRQVIYEDDEWFVAQEPLYYDQIIYRLYINLGCGPISEMDRIPENPMDKYVLDQMTKHTTYDITAPFVGDHAVLNEDSEISFFSEEIGTAIDHADVGYTMLFTDRGYTCEDIVVYSMDEFSERDVMYWWEKDYPVVKDTKNYVVNPLLGKSIEPKDFDYPYIASDAHYGELVEPGKHGVPGDYAPYYYSENRAVSDAINVKYAFFPIRPLSDGMEITLSGHIRADIAELEAYFCVLRINTRIYKSPIIFQSWPNVLLFETLAAAKSVLYTISDTGEITYLPEDAMFIKRHYMLRSFDIYTKFSAVSDWPLNDFYVGVLVTIRPKNKVADGSVRWLDYIVEFGTGVEEYDEDYLFYRKPWIHPTDLGFVTRDFYNDFFGFKFYVNLGCGEDLDAFPLDFKDDFERWIFTTARLGNRNEEYVFDGNLAQVSDVPIIELYKFWVIDVNFIVNMNNYEFTVLDSGSADYFAWPFIEAYDLLTFNADGVISSVLKDFGKSISAVKSENRTTLYDSGKFEVSKLLGFGVSETNEILNENYILSFANEEKGKLEFGVKFQCNLTLFENVLSVGQELLAIPINDAFFYDNSTSITVPAAIEIAAHDHEAIVAFKFVYEYGSIDGGQFLRAPFDDLFITYEDPMLADYQKEVGQVFERVLPKRNEVYRDVGYICFWVQVVKYNYVIDWLAGHYVDYYYNPVEAEYIRYVSCYGVPPGDWKEPIKDYPDPEDILPEDHGLHILEKDPKDPTGGYRHTEYPWYLLNPSELVPRDRKHGYIVFPGPGDTVGYILDPVDPPYPYRWTGGTSILLTKSVRNSEMTEMVTVEDAFYFALFDQNGERVSEVQMMSLKESALADGTTSPGASFGALVFFDLKPNTTYVIRETDKNGKILTKDLVSEFSGNKYSNPVDNLTVTTKEEGKCVDGGDMPNLLEKFGEGKAGGKGEKGSTGSTIPDGDNYKPCVYIPEDGEDPGTDIGGKAPFDIEDPIPDIIGIMEEIPPVYDEEHFPPVIPPILVPTPPDKDPVDGPGYVGKLVRVKEILKGRELPVATIPVDMLGRIWTYHYIPATFVLELTGIKMDYMEDFFFEFEEPFQFSFDEFSVEVEMPFAFETAEFTFEMYKGFLFDEDFILIEATQDVFIDETFFEIDALFEDFKFDSIDYDGKQEPADPDVVADVIIFDGLEHPLCYPRGMHGLIYYQLEGEDTWSREIPKKIFAGQYTVKWYAMASLDYLAYGSKQDYHLITCTIRRANPIITIEKVSVIYGETKDISFEYTGDGVVSCEAASEECCCEIVSQIPIQGLVKPVSTVVMRVTGKQCGMPRIIISSTQGDNFFRGEFIVLCTVTEATMQYKVSSVKSEYTGLPIPCNNIQIFGPIQYQIMYSPIPMDETTGNKYKEVEFYTEVGDYTVYFEITAANFKPVYGKFRLTIEYAVVKIFVVPYFGTFDYQTHKLISEVTGPRGTMWYSTDKENWYTKIPDAVMPGKYLVYWYCVGDINHYDVGTREQPNEVVAEIEKMDITDTLEDMEFDLQNPQEVTVPIPTASLGRLSITYTDYSVIFATLVGKQVTIKPLKVGDVFVHIRQAEGLFYKAHVFSFHVDVIDSRIVYNINHVTVTYTGAHVVPVGVEVIEPDTSVCKIRYSRMPITPETSDLLPEPPSFINVGIYNIYFVLSAYDYTPVYDFYTLTILPAENFVSVSNVELDYDGESHALAIPEPGYFGTIYYSTLEPSLGGNWSNIVPTAAMPGVYRVYWYCKGDSNHVDVGSKASPFMLMPSIIKKLNYIASDISVMLYRSQIDYTIQLDTPCIGNFAPIRYSTSEFIDPDGTYIDNAPIGLLHIKPADVGEFVMYITQHGDQIYNDVLFTVYVKIR